MSGPMKMESSQAAKVLVLVKERLTQGVAQYLKDKGFMPLFPAEQEPPLDALNRTLARAVIYDMMDLPAAVDFLQSVKASLPEVQVIGISMKDEPQYAAYFFSLGLSAYVWKGGIEHELEEALHAVVDRRTRYLSLHVKHKLPEQKF